MPVAEEVKEVLKKNEGKNTELSNFLRCKRFIKEKREQGILIKKGARLPNLQEIERYGYDTFFTKRPT
jgi:hypothetical protein